MNNDFEKNRAEYVTQLEIQLQAMQRQLAEIKAQERWIPRIGAEIDPAAQQGRITLSFGGKNQTAVVSLESLAEHSITDVTTSVLELGFQEMVNSRLREIIEPEVARLARNAKSLVGKKQW